MSFIVTENMKITYLADHQDVSLTLAAWFYHEWAYLHPDRTPQEVIRLIAARTNKDKIPRQKKRRAAARLASGCVDGYCSTP
jgi:hypothetical protein